MGNEKYLANVRKACKITSTVVIVVIILNFLLYASLFVNAFIAGFKAGYYGYESDVYSAEELKTYYLPEMPKLTDSVPLIIIAAIASLIFFATGIYMIVRIFMFLSVLKKSESPFNTSLSNHIRSIGISFMILDIADTVAFVSAFNLLPYSIGINFVAGIVLWCFSVIFKYGTELQRESDETL